MPVPVPVKKTRKRRTKQKGGNPLIYNVSGQGLSNIPPRAMTRDTIHVNISHNNLLRLPRMPPDLRTLIANDNLITHIDTLPGFLNVLDVRNNRLQSITELPSSISTLRIEGNPDLSGVILTVPQRFRLLSFDSGIVLDTYTYPIIVDELHIDGQLIEDEVPAKYGDVIVLSRDYAFDNEEENEPDYMYERRMRRQARVERQPVPVQRLENVTPLNTRTVKSANLIKTCYNPLAANYENIAGEREAGVATIYIANTSNTITKALCLDEDSLTGYLRGKASIFFKCLPTVSERALYIRPEDTTQEPLRRIAFDIICYVYEKDAKKIRLGKSYIFIPSQTPVGRIVSQKVLNGNSVVSAEHCQNDYSRDYIYDIKEVIIT